MAELDELGKCVPPCKICEILGIGFDAPRMILFLTARRAQQIINLLQQLTDSVSVSVLQLQSSVGLLNFISIVLPAGKPYLSATILALKSLGRNPARYTRLVVSADMRSDWAMWRTVLLTIATRPVSRGVHLPTIRAAAWALTSPIR